VSYEQPAKATRAGDLADAIEAELRRLRWWRGDAAAPPVVAAFGAGTMTYSQWIETTLVTRLREIAAGEAALPTSSYLATQAVREFDGVDEADPLIDLLSQVDRLAEDQTGG
jgi:uncharacterized protein YqcC (DUF446 family)